MMVFDDLTERQIDVRNRVREQTRAKDEATRDTAPGKSGKASRGIEDRVRRTKALTDPSHRNS